MTFFCQSVTIRLAVLCFALLEIVPEAYRRPFSIYKVSFRVDIAVRVYEKRKRLAKKAGCFRPK